MSNYHYLLLLLYSSIAVAQPHFTPVEPTGVPYIIIITNVEVQGSGIVPEAEIAIYDDSLCVGVGVFDGNYNFQLSAWRANQNQELPGFTNGAEMGFRVWTLYDGSWQEFVASPEYEQGDGTFGSGPYAVLSLNNSIVGINPKNKDIKPESFGMKAYPNPFNAEVIIPITLSDRSSGKLSINSLGGHQIWSREVHGSEQMRWTGMDLNGEEVPSGIYLIVLKSGSQQMVEPITLLK